MVTKLEFLQSQKAVQNGDCTKWQIYLFLLIATQAIGMFQEVHDTYYKETVKKYVQINILDQYQTFGRIHERGILLLTNMVSAEILIPLNIITVVIGFYGMSRNIEMLSKGTFNWNQTLVAISLFGLTILCGAVCGKLESQEEETNAKLSVNRNDCIKFQLFSDSYRKNIMKLMNKDYSRKTLQRSAKAFLRYFPGVLKQFLFVALVWGMMDTISGTSLYSESYLLLSAFGTVLNIAEGIGRIISKLVEIYQMRKNPHVLGLYEAKKKREAMLEENNGLIKMTDGTLIISNKINISISVAAHRLYYKLPKTIVVPKGEHQLITGEKKTGKTRLLNVLTWRFKDAVLIYSTNSKILARLGDNFDVRQPLDVSLIKELACGLKLQDLEKMPEEQIESWQMGEINTADKNLLTVLVMLYMGVKDPEKSRIMVFDEILANIDSKNSKEIMKFIISKINSIGATGIFVAHNSQQDLIRKFCASEIIFQRCEEVINVTQVKLHKSDF